MSRVPVLLKCCFGGGSKGKYVCLLGLSDSGKTLLFRRVSGAIVLIWYCSDIIIT